jgi:phenylpropionate dioxygenase-like ring-hydroxylating dioxygenase large terminal subunit
MIHSALEHFEWRDLVQRDRVHRCVYTDPRIFDLEMERVFTASWIYVGHESQLPTPGSFLATRIGREPVLLLRHKDNNIRAVFNRCAHKGMQLVPDDVTGQRRALRCGYHGWIYDTDGRLRTIPAERGYDGTSVCKSAADASLASIGSLALYRGFIFARLKATGPELHDWLGPMRSSLDNMVDRSPEGRIEVAGGVFRYVHHANWKFFLENTLDALHPMVVHQSVTLPARRLSTERSAAGLEDAFDLQMVAPFGASYSFFDDMGQRACPYGHGDLGNSSSLHSSYDAIPGYLPAMIARYGEAQARQILAVNRNNSVLYPSVMFKAPVSLLRIVKPIAVDRTMIETWHFRLCGAPEELLRRTIRYSNVVNSPAGAVGPDDHEAYRRLQSGLQATAGDWVKMARYPDQGAPDSDGSRSAPGTSDLVHRNQHAAWRDYMDLSAPPT